MAAEVAEGGDLLRDAGFFIAFFFTVTKFTTAAALFQFAKSAKIYQKKPNMPQKSLAILVA